MFKKIMVPVDLTHAARMTKALKCSADLARHYDASVVYTAVTSDTPGSVAHNPKEFREKLATFAEGQAEKAGIKTDSHAVVVNDPAVDLDPALLKAADEMSADLIVMASHVPGLGDHFWPSNGGQVAGHAKVSVFVVRGDGDS